MPKIQTRIAGALSWQRCQMLETDSSMAPLGSKVPNLRRRTLQIVGAVLSSTAVLPPSPALAQSTPASQASEGDRPWLDKALDPDARARLLANAMTLEEKLAIVHGPFGRARLGHPQPERAIGSAGFVPGVPRLGIPDLQEADAGVGVTNPADVRPGDGATALPSGLATAAGWSTTAAYQNGSVIGDEAWKKGFNVMLAGGMNLVRDPRNGRNFEYLGEDPLLAGMLAGSIVRGIQAHHVASTVKHYALNNQETDRFTTDVRIDEGAARESDLLAFEIAVEQGKPASIMCAYNLVNGRWACENDWLLNTVLKKDWAYPGWVMSDWGAVHSTAAALDGLDQQSGEQFDKALYFGAPLAEKVRTDPRYRARLDDMVHRVLRSMFAAGLIDYPARRGAIDYATNAKVAQELAEGGMVLLKNRGDLLPLKEAKRIAIIGGMATFGVISGGGSSYTTSIDGPGVQIPSMDGSVPGSPRLVMYHPSSPAEALQNALPGAKLEYDGGNYPTSAAALARSVDVPIVFATQWTTENVDVPDLSLPGGQDALIEAVAEANPNTIVVLETGGPVKMPWLDKVAGVIEAWYPGGRGGEAIASVLTGRANPSGRLPVTFPADESQLPRPNLPGIGRSASRQSEAIVPEPYVEGSDVGYRWYSARGLKPLFPFGYGLGYSTFEYSGLHVTGGDTITVTFTIKNTSDRAGADVPQVYLSGLGGKPLQRLIGWDKVQLAPGESREVTVTADRRLLARFDTKANQWSIIPGEADVTVSRSATDPVLKGQAIITGGRIAP